MQSLQKKASRDNIQEKKIKATPPTNYQYGQFQYGKTPIQTKQLNLQTFYGNPEAETFSIRFDWDDGHIASSCSDGTIKVFSLTVGKLIQNLTGSSGGGTPTTTLRWRPEIKGQQKLKNVLVSGNSDGTLMYWHGIQGKQLFRLVEPNNQILAIDYALDGSKLATGGKDFQIRVYDDETNQMIIKYEQAESYFRKLFQYTQSKTLGHANRVFAIKFLPDPNIFISGGWDGNILFWDLRERKAFASIYGPNLTGDALDFKNGQILTGSYRNTEQLQIWDYKQRSLIQQIDWVPGNNPQNYYIYGAQFSKIGTDTIMAGSSGLQELKIFDCTQNYKPTCHIENLHAGVYAVDYGNVSNRIAFGGGEGVVYICSLQSVKK